MKRPIDHFRNFWCADFFLFLDLDSAVAQKVTLFVFFLCKFRFHEGSNTVQWNCTFIYIWQKRVTRLSLVNVKSNG